MKKTYKVKRNIKFTEYSKTQLNVCLLSKLKEVFYEHGKNGRSYWGSSFLSDWNHNVNKRITSYYTRQCKYSKRDRNSVNNFGIIPTFHSIGRFYSINQFNQLNEVFIGDTTQEMGVITPNFFFYGDSA